MSSLLFALSLLLALSGEETPALICCGDKEVFVLPIGNDMSVVENRVWRWQATDSPTIPAEAKKWFDKTDDCKPLADSILITSSFGGIAIIRRSDKHCLFYAYAPNAHSACLLPGNRVAVAASIGCDELQLYALTDSAEPSKPLTTIPLNGAHGVLWDAERKRLWTLCHDDLLLVEVRGRGTDVELHVEKKWELPTPDGHDLSPTRDGQSLFVTTGDHVYRFNKAEGTFALDPALGNRKKVKSVAEHPTTGEIVFHQATEEHWWSDTIRFVGDRAEVRLPDEKLYKIRWDVVPPAKKSEDTQKPSQ